MSNNENNHDEKVVLASAGNEKQSASADNYKDVADSIGCTATVYSRYEREEREPDIEMLCRLANYFQVSIDYLVENNPNYKEVSV